MIVYSLFLGVNGSQPKGWMVFWKFQRWRLVGEVPETLDPAAVGPKLRSFDLGSDHPTFRREMIQNGGSDIKGVKLHRPEVA